MNLVELFAGSRSVGKIAEELGFKVFSSDIEPFDKIDYVVDIMNFDCSVVPFVPDAIWCSPPCQWFSVASIGRHWNKNHTPKTENANIGVAIVRRTLEIIEYFNQVNPRLIWFMENPTGKLRKLPIVKGNFDRTTITYCSYGDNRMKPTDIWSNNIFNPIFNGGGGGGNQGQDVTRGTNVTMNLHQGEAKPEHKEGELIMIEVKFPNSFVGKFC